MLCDCRTGSIAVAIGSKTRVGPVLYSHMTSSFIINTDDSIGYFVIVSCCLSFKLCDQVINIWIVRVYLYLTPLLPSGLKF